MIFLQQVCFNFPEISVITMAHFYEGRFENDYYGTSTLIATVGNVETKTQWQNCKTAFAVFLKI